MRLRVLFAALVCAAVSVVPTWLTMQPLLARANAAAVHWQRLSTLILVADAVLVTLLCFVVLHFSFGRPIERLEESMKRLSGPSDDDGGSLVRLDRALRRLAQDLGEERRLNGTRLAELTRSNETLVRLQAELVANDRLATVGKLAAGVAHEVGNPLAGILGYLSVVRMRAKGNEEMLDLVVRIEAEVQRIDQIVRGLLELGRPSRGKAQIVDVRPLVDSAVRLLGASPEFANVAVTVDGPGAWLLRAEPGPLSQVLVNLLLNAAQAMEGKGAVRISLSEEAGAGRLVVDDEGPGLPPEARARIFEPFFTTKSAGKGTGLGLAVSQHLLSQFEGRLELGEKPGRGARFVISLPLP